MCRSRPKSVIPPTDRSMNQFRPQLLPQLELVAELDRRCWRGRSGCGGDGAGGGVGGALAWGPEVTPGTRPVSETFDGGPFGSDAAHLPHRVHSIEREK